MAKLEKILRSGKTFFQKYVKPVARPMYKALRTGTRATGRALETVTQATLRSYRAHQETIDTAILTTSAAVTAVSVIDDYTGTGFETSAAIGILGIGTAYGTKRITSSLFPEQAHATREQKRIVYTARALVAGAAITLESAVIAGYTTCFGEDCSLLDNAKAFIKNTTEMNVLTMGLYLYCEVAKKGIRTYKEKLQRGSQNIKRIGTTLVIGASAVALAAATNILNFGSYDSITPFDKEGILEQDVRPIDKTKLPAALQLKDDILGTYASVHLSKGESLYSAVVLEHTDLTEHADVMAATRKIQARSLALDLSQTHTSYTFHVVGFNPENIHPEDEIKIPLSLLSDRYRVGYQEPQIKKPLIIVPVIDPSGLHIILDAGHGGSDPGSGAYGVIEDEVAYDVMVRAMDVLEKKYSITVHPIVQDNNTGFIPLTTLRKGSNEVVLTTPPYRTGNTAMAANLRSYKVNALYTQLTAQGVSPHAIVFTSFHTDAITAHAQGMMIYYPDAALRSSSLERSGAYSRYQEVVADPTIEVEPNKRQTQDFSYSFATTFMDIAPKFGVETHSHQGIRGRIHNRGKTYVPAVLRNNPVPIKVLVEVGNCNNRRDAQRLLDSTYRQNVAEAYGAAVATYFKNGGQQ